jgi:hypothetical protein
MEVHCIASVSMKQAASILKVEVIGVKIWSGYLGKVPGQLSLRTTEGII